MRRVRSGEDVIKAREIMGMTQPQLAEALRIGGTDSAQTVRRWERGPSGVPGPVSVAIEALLTGFRPTNYRGGK